MKSGLLTVKSKGKEVRKEEAAAISMGRITEASGQCIPVCPSRPLLDLVKIDFHFLWGQTICSFVQQ